MKKKLFYHRSGVLMPAALCLLMLLSACGNQSGKTVEASSETVTEETEAAEENAAGRDEETGGTAEDSAASEEAAKNQGEENTASGQAEAPSSENQEASGSRPYVMVEQQYASHYDEETGKLLSSAEYPKLVLRNPEAFPALSQALADWSDAQEAYVLEEENNLFSAAGEAATENPDFSGYTSETELELHRADEKIFSFTCDSYTYSGGAHGYGGVSGYQFFTETGAQLLLGDAVADRDAFYNCLVGKLEARYASEDLLFPEWKEQVRAEVYEEPFDPEETGGLEGVWNLTFALNADSMTVYFSPYDIAPYAAGTITLDIPYTEEGTGLNRDICSSAKDRSVWKLEPYESLSLDLDGDGTPETVGYAPVEQEAEGSTMQYEAGVDENMVRFEAGYGVTAAYVLRREDQYMLYAECQSDNDWRYLSLMDLVELSQGETEPKEYYEAFYENVPADAESFYLGTRGELISTVPISREHELGEDGLPSAKTNLFTIDGLTLTAKQPVPAFTPDLSGQLEIPEGAEVKAVETDESSFVVFQGVEDGSLYRVEISGEDWPHTIDGKDIAEYFEGLVFAG